MRQRGRIDLIWLCTKILGYRDVSERVHGKMAHSMQQFKGGRDWLKSLKTVNGSPAVGTAKELVENYEPYCDIWNLEGPRERLILIPRNHLKSSVCTIAHTIQWIINYPNIRILISSGTGDQVKGFLRAIREHFQTNEWLRYLYPEFVPHGKNVKDWGNQDSFTVPCRTMVRPETTVASVSVGAVVAGAHYDVIKHDDMVDKENIRTPEQIQNVKNHFGFLDPLLQRVDKEPGRGWTDVIGTRYDYSDLYGALIDAARKKEESGQKSDWLILEQSAIVKGELSDPDNCETLWPERFGPKELLRIADDPTRGWPHLSCTPYNSPVLMGDWTDKPIGDMRAGDMVVGFKKTERGRHNNLMGLCKSKVIAVHKTLGTVYKLTLSTGRVVFCTADHKWFTGRYARPTEPGRKTYNPAKVGTELFNVVPPLPALTPDQARWMDWLGGLLDGEGSCHKGNTIFISQSEVANPEVSAMIPECLEALGFSWTQFNRAGGDYGGRHHKAATQWMIKGGRAMMRQIATQARMAKRQRIIDGLYIRSTRLTQKNGGKHIVISIESVGTQEVYALETETGNYVVWGYASSNSQYLMNPRPDSAGLIESEKEIVWVPPDVIRKIYAYLSLHVTVDLAGMEPSTNKLADNDYTVINLHGFGRDGVLYIITVMRGRYTPFEVIDLLFKLSAIHPRLLDIKVEKEAHARVLLPFLKREMTKRQKWLPIVEIRRDNRTSKQQRIKGLQPWFRNGSIKFADNQVHKLAIIDEIMRFPKYAHDDILDTIADAMQNRDGGVTSDVTPLDKSQAPDMIEMNQRMKLPNGDYQVANFNPDLKELMDKIWGTEVKEETNLVDSLTGW